MKQYPKEHYPCIVIINTFLSLNTTTFVPAYDATRRFLRVYIDLHTDLLCLSPFRTISLII